MTPEAILQRARADGVTLALAEPETINVGGKRGVVERWLPSVRAHKAELVRLLSRPVLWQSQSQTTVRETEERLAIVEHDGELQKIEAENRVRMYAWQWRNVDYDPRNGFGAGTLITASADAETVKQELEARFGVFVAQLWKVTRSSG
jgi:hypothetical protein